MKKLILLIDDDADILNLLHEILSDEGHHVMTATNGKEGLDHYKQFKPSLIISDVMMPILDGFALVKSIRTDFGDTLTPIVLMSGGIKPFEVTGSHFFLPKPLSIDQILKLVDELLS